MTRHASKDGKRSISIRNLHCVRLSMKLGSGSDGTYYKPLTEHSKKRDSADCMAVRSKRLVWKGFNPLQHGKKQVHVSTNITPPKLLRVRPVLLYLSMRARFLIIARAVYRSGHMIGSDNKTWKFAFPNLTVKIEGAFGNFKI